MVRGLNETGGRNRLKFQKLKSRVKHARARVDVVHKVRMYDVMAPVLDAGIHGDGIGWDGIGWGLCGKRQL